ncbi:helix-turn-helix domain-containing protein [Niallia taxi]|uniref:helix-turn-helix domain-containing protein n=1 Tax=Niallia taxi TaxID=2499688 RepID=UPI003D26B71F
MDKYWLIAPYLNQEKTLKAIAEETGITKRTLHNWINKYNHFGLRGLIRKGRTVAQYKPYKQPSNEAPTRNELKRQRNLINSFSSSVRLSFLLNSNNWN